jgi:hypothetical protein
MLGISGSGGLAMWEEAQSSKQGSGKALRSPGVLYMPFVRESDMLDYLRCVVYKGEPTIGCFSPLWLWTLVLCGEQWSRVLHKGMVLLGRGKVDQGVGFSRSLVSR